jgi:hypothetical protein
MPGIPFMRYYRRRRSFIGGDAGVLGDLGPLGCLDLDVFGECLRRAAWDRNADVGELPG